MSADTRDPARIMGDPELTLREDNRDSSHGYQPEHEAPATADVPEPTEAMDERTEPVPFRLLQRERMRLTYGPGGASSIVVGDGDDARELEGVYRYQLTQGPGAYELPRLVLWTLQTERATLDVPEAELVDLHALLARLDRQGQQLASARLTARRLAIETLRQYSNGQPLRLTTEQALGYVDNAALVVGAYEPDATMGDVVARAWKLADDSDERLRAFLGSGRHVGEDVTLHAELAAVVRELCTRLSLLAEPVVVTFADGHDPLEGVSGVDEQGRTPEQGGGTYPSGQ